MKKYDNFCRALKNLEEGYQYEEPYSNVVLTGLVALYEICFEQAWKAMKEIMEQTREHYIKMFEALKVKIEQEWN